MNGVRCTALGVLVLLLGCQPKASDTDTSTSAIEPPAEPSIEAPVDPAVARWPVSAEAFGSITFGMSVEEAISASGEPLDIDEDEYNTGCVYGHAQSMPAGMYFMVNEGRIARVDVGTYDIQAMEVITSQVRTAEGIGIGSTAEEAIEVYGAKASIVPSKYGGENDVNIEMITEDASGAGSGMVFETIEGRIESWRAGLAEEVQWVEGCS